MASLWDLQVAVNDQPKAHAAQEGPLHITSAGTCVHAIPPKQFSLESYMECYQLLTKDTGVCQQLSAPEQAYLKQGDIKAVMNVNGIAGTGKPKKVLFDTLLGQALQTPRVRVAEHGQQQLPETVNLATLVQDLKALGWVTTDAAVQLQQLHLGPFCCSQLTNCEHPADTLDAVAPDHRALQDAGQNAAVDAATAGPGRICPETGLTVPDQPAAADSDDETCASECNTLSSPRPPDASTAVHPSHAGNGSLPSQPLQTSASAKLLAKTAPDCTVTLPTDTNPPATSPVRDMAVTAQPDMLADALKAEEAIAWLRPAVEAVKHCVRVIPPHPPLAKSGNSNDVVAAHDHVRELTPAGGTVSARHAESAHDLVGRQVLLVMTDSLTLDSLGTTDTLLPGLHVGRIRKFHGQACHADSCTGGSETSCCLFTVRFKPDVSERRMGRSQIRWLDVTLELQPSLQLGDVLKLCDVQRQHLQDSWLAVEVLQELPTSALAHAHIAQPSKRKAVTAKAGGPQKKAQAAGSCKAL